MLPELHRHKDCARRTAPDCCNVVWHLRYERRIIPGHGDRAIIRNTPPRWHIILLLLTMENMKQTLKITAAILGIIAAGALFWYVVIKFMWMCYYAGIPM